MDCWKRPAASAPPALSSLRCRSAAGLRPPPGFERQAAAGTGALAAAGKHLAISESKLVAWKTEPVSEVDEAGIGNLCEEAVNKVILRQAVNESQLFIGNLARDSPPGGSTTTCGGITTNSVHHEDIRNFFNERLSVVERVDMNVDATSGVSRGFAFVKCRDPWSALMCRLSSSTFIRGRACTIDWTRSDMGDNETAANAPDKRNHSIVEYNDTDRQEQMVKAAHERIFRAKRNWQWPCDTSAPLSFPPHFGPVVHRQERSGLETSTKPTASIEVHNPRQRNQLPAIDELCFMATVALSSATELKRDRCAGDAAHESVSTWSVPETAPGTPNQMKVFVGGRSGAAPMI